MGQLILILTEAIQKIKVACYPRYIGAGNKIIGSWNSPRSITATFAFGRWFGKCEPELVVGVSFACVAFERAVCKNL